MIVYSIYKLTNTINGKSYIGFTSKAPEKRWAAHLEKAHAKKNVYLYDAINKYGWENFTKEVIYCSQDAEHTLSVMEPYFIREYNTFFTDEHGYNMTRGGEGTLGAKFSDERKIAISIRLKGSGNSFFGRHHTDETKQKVSEAVKRSRHLRVGEAAPFAGHKHSEESRRQIGDTQGDTWQITFPDGHNETVHNLRAFCREHKLTAPLMIAVSKGRQRHHKNFRCTNVAKAVPKAA
jgi:group I intron endonuclease